MPLAALIFGLVVLSILLPLAIAAILWPSAMARLNAAAIRTLPVAAPKSMRESAASNSSPGFLRFWGISGVAIISVVVFNVVKIVREDGITAADASAGPGTASPFFLIGMAQLTFGLVVVIRSRRIFERLRSRFEAEGASLRRWMVVVVGAVGIVGGATVVYVGISLAWPRLLGE